VCHSIAIAQLGQGQTLKQRVRTKLSEVDELFKIGIQIAYGPHSFLLPIGVL
jgi:hypothetical protein